MAPSKLSAISSKFRSAFRVSRAEDRAQAQEDQDADAESSSDSASTIHPGTAASAPPRLLPEQPAPVFLGAATIPPAPERPSPPPSQPLSAPVASSSGLTITLFTRPIDIYNFHASRSSPSATTSEAPATDLGCPVNFSRPLNQQITITATDATMMPLPSTPTATSFISPLPARPLAAALTVVHFHCATTHNTRRKSSNRYAPTLCMTCHKAGEREMIMCKHCGLRVCRVCAGGLTESNGDLGKMLEELIRTRGLHVG